MNTHPSAKHTLLGAIEKKCHTCLTHVRSANGRYDNHAKSKKLEQKLLDQMKLKMTDLMNRDKTNPSYIDNIYLEDSTHALFQVPMHAQCCCVLMCLCGCVYAYLLLENQNEEKA